MNRRAFLAFGAAAAASCGRPAGKPFRGYAFIATQGSSSIAVLDLGVFALDRVIPLPSAPIQVLGHQTRKCVYVLTPASDAIHEIDAASLTIRRTARLGPDLQSMQFGFDEGPDPPATVLWAMSRAAKRLYRIPLDTFAPEPFATLTDAPTDFSMATWVRAAAISYGLHGAVGFISTDRPAPEKRIDLQSEIGSVRFQSNGEQLLVANIAERSLSILRTRDGAMVTQLPLALRPENFCMKEDGGEIYVSGAGADAVVVVQPYQTQIAATLLAGNSPGGMAVAGEYLLVTNPLSGDLSIIDIETRRLAAIARVGQEPRTVAVTEDRQFALVLNHLSGDVAILQIPAIRANKFKRMSLLTMIPVGQQPVGAAMVRLQG